MIPKKFRLTTRLFDRFFKRSKRFNSGSFTFLIADSQGNPRFSVDVGKKDSKKATQRNRIRRQIYEVLRKRLVENVQDKNVICLYKGNEIMHNSSEFSRSVEELLDFLKRKNSKH